jgi:hypothetical protein
MTYRFFKIVFLVVSLSLLNISLKAQISNSSKSERYEKFSKSKKQVGNDILSLLDSADFYLKKDRNKAFDFLESAYLLSLKKENIDKQPLVLHKLGDYYQYYKQHDLAAMNYENSLKSMTVNAVDIEIVLKAGNQYVMADYPEKAISLFKKYESAFENESKAKISIGFADAYLKLNNIDSALYFYNQAEKLTEKLNLRDLNTEIKLKKARLFSNFDSAKQYELLNQANTQAKLENNQRLEIETESELADYYKKSNQDEMEIQSRQNVISNLEKNDMAFTDEAEFTEKKVYEQVNIAKTQTKRGEYDKALEILNEISELPTKNSNTNLLELKKEAVKLLLEVYLKTGQDEEAIKNYKHYAEILDMLYQKSELEYKNIKKMNNQLRDHQWRIDFLEKDKAIYDAEIELIDVERNIQKEKLKYQRRYIILLIFLIALLFISLIMLVLKNRVQKKHNSYLALKSLRTQMNPHFIFNALNSINNFIVKNDEINANKYLARFSKLMRRILNISELDFIPLEQEIEILELYLQIEHMRFPDKFDYKFEIDEKLNTTDFDIPPMLIQPYIENAVWHGLRYKDKGGILKVEMKLESEILKVRIEDNGIGRAKSKELKTENQLNNKSKGIKNTQARLQILSKIYKSDISQKITDLNEDGSGTVVEIYIPNLNKK